MINKTFRLFISSTFSDFLREREILNGSIYTAMDKFCRDRGYAFQLVDLRWGVSPGSVLDQKTVPICLQEVRRCEATSPKPNFLIMVGERYGTWMPVPYEIEPSVFTQLLSQCNKEEKSLITEWYHYDDNAIGGSYYLKRRTGEYEQDECWSNIQDRLHHAIVHAARECAFSEKTAAMLQGSATEQEIYEGLLGHEERCENAIVIFRNGHPSRDADITKVMDLREKILKKLNSSGCSEQLVSLVYGDEKEYEQTFTRTVLTMLQEQISAEIERLEREGRPLSGQSGALARNCVPNACFYGREEELAEIEGYCAGDVAQPLVLRGSSGSGKTSLLNEFIRRSERTVFYSFFGEENNYTLCSAITDICEKIAVHYSLRSEHFPTEENILETLWDCFLELAGKGPCVVILDGLDSFYDLECVTKPLFPSDLPQNVKLIFSVTDQTEPRSFLPGKWVEFSIGPFGGESGLRAFDQILMRRGRKISQAAQRAVVESHFGEGLLPIHTRLLADICSAWRSGDHVQDLPATAEEAVLGIIDSMSTQEGHGRHLTLNALALVLAAPIGIEENDLVSLLIRIPDVKEELRKESFFPFGEEKIPFVLWARLFSDLESLLTVTVSQGFAVIKPTHRIVGTAFAMQHREILKRAEDMLSKYFLAMNNYIDPHKKTPNIKKCLSILPLLLRRNALDLISTLLIDESFIDAAVKSGMLDELLGAYKICIQNFDAPEKVTSLRSMEARLLNERETLLCYRGGLLSCLDSKGCTGSSAPRILHTARQASWDSIPPGALIAWSPKGEILAYGHGHLIHLRPDGDPERDLQLYIAIEGDQNYRIAELRWLRDTSILVALSNGKLLLFEYDGSALTKKSEFGPADTEIGLAYFDRPGILMYGYEARVISVDIENGTQLSSYSEKGLQHIGQTEDTIILVGDHGVSERRAEDGSLLRTERTKELSPAPYSVLGGAWLLVNDDPSAPFYACLTNQPIGAKNRGKQRYLYPPDYKTYCGVVVGEKTAVFWGKEHIAWVDLSDMSLCLKEFSGISQVAWRKKDKELSVLCSTGLFDFDVRDLGQEGQTTCFTSKKPLKKGKEQLSYIRRLVARLQKLLTMRDHTRYSALFSEDGLFPSASKTGEDRKRATLITYSDDGKYAVAYEMNDEILVFGRDHRPLLVLDKFEWGITDVLLQMCFSSDSRFLLLRRNEAVAVVDIEKGRIQRKLSVKWRPVLQAEIARRSDFLSLMLSDRKIYQIPLKGRKASDVPRRTKGAQTDVFCSPYCSDPIDLKHPTYSLFLPTILDQMETPTKWFTQNRWYFGQKHSLHFTNGNFYLDGDVQRAFSARYEAFDQCLLHIRRSYPSEFAAFIQEKNDLSSGLFELEGGRYLILISKLLRSVIVFDIATMEVLLAYKHHSAILGWQIKQLGELTRLVLIGDTAPIKDEVIIDVRET